MKLTPPLRLSLGAIALAFLVSVMTPAGRSQEVAPVNPCEGLARAWVDPVHGHDPLYQLPISITVVDLALIGQINDPNAPFKTLQAAIDAVHAHLGYQWTQNATTQGIVYALPGLYGQHGQGSSLDLKQA